MTQVFHLKEVLRRLNSLDRRNTTTYMSSSCIAQFMSGLRAAGGLVVWNTNIKTRNYTYSMLKLGAGLDKKPQNRASIR